MVGDALFPGEVQDLALSWDFGRNAVDAAQGTGGRIALVPQWVVAEMGGGGQMTAAGAMVVGGSLAGSTVRVKGLRRLWLSDLALPPTRPASSGGREPDAEEPRRGQVEIVHRLVRRHLLTEGEVEPPDLCAAAPDALADRLSRMLFEAVRGGGGSL